MQILKVISDLLIWNLWESGEEICFSKVQGIPMYLKFEKHYPT